MQDSSKQGKVKGDASIPAWQLGWWEVSPLMDRIRKPLAWSRSSVIFSADSTMPRIHARHFSSTKQFTLDPPPEVQISAAGYGPPTVITVSPGDDWLFAYFPGRRSNVACLWSRGPQIDSWSVRDTWTLEIGDGIVCADWLSSHREWVMTDSGAPARRPARGQGMPTNSPLLILVSQSLSAYVCYLPPLVTQVRRARVSLLQSRKVPDSSAPNSIPTGGRRICVNAAIGISYSEPTIVIATRSKLIPPDSGLDHIDLVLSPELQGSIPTPDLWEIWGEEPTVELCELFIPPPQIPSPVTRPTFSILLPNHHVIDLAFFYSPPELSGSASPTVTKDPRKPVRENTGDNKNIMYLAITTLDYPDYATSLRSELRVHTLVRAISNNPPSFWTLQRTEIRSFDDEILAFLAPCSAKNRLFAGRLLSRMKSEDEDHKDVKLPKAVRSSQLNEAYIGCITVLNTETLEEDTSWEAAPIFTLPKLAGRDVPSSVVLSPNQALLCIVPSSPNARLSFHLLPKPQVAQSSNAAAAPAITREYYKSLSAAIYSRNSPSDLVHTLIRLPGPPNVVSNVLYNVISILESNSFGLSEMWLEEILGLATEIYRGRAEQATDEAEKALLTQQWRTAYDICSMSSLNSAFADCLEDGSYDLDAIWQLVGLSGWFIEFLERLMKECVSIGDTMSQGEGTIKVDTAAETPGLEPSLQTPLLLHLAHPYAIRNVQVALSHVKRFRDEIKGHTARGENAQIAKEFLMDLLNSSGVNLDELSPILEECKANARKASPDNLRRSLANLTPAPALSSHISAIINKILSSKIINRPKLFIKSSDLVDGVVQLSISEPPNQQDRDSVTKSRLLRLGNPLLTCVRCGGRSEVGLSPVRIAAERWSAWENAYMYRCVCAGGWTMQST
ncbi:hypothetical protein K474DRAFT_1654738 [Panus rudis PR-1116 ss-1]|nr:hypothetical protein K474DRAFT_1654738 [Panus rudis PR-1116 ss-1]